MKKRIKMWRSAASITLGYGQWVDEEGTNHRGDALDKRYAIPLVSRTQGPPHRIHKHCELWTKPVLDRPKRDLLNSESEPESAELWLILTKHERIPT